LLSVTETSHIQGEEGELAVFCEGIGNLAMAPEFGSTEGLRQLFEMLEERERIGEALIQAIQARKQRVEVLFSRLDLGLRWKTELSYVVSTHASKEAGDVVIGVVGPIRMDYASMVPFVAHVARMLEERTAITLKRGFS
jgi:heat-inducible transcriptional repressor